MTLIIIIMMMIMIIMQTFESKIIYEKRGDHDDDSHDNIHIEEQRKH